MENNKEQNNEKIEESAYWACVFIFLGISILLGIQYDRFEYIILGSFISVGIAFLAEFIIRAIYRRSSK